MNQLVQLKNKNGNVYPVTWEKAENVKSLITFNTEIIDKVDDSWWCAYRYGKIVLLSIMGTLKTSFVSGDKVLFTVSQELKPVIFTYSHLTFGIGNSMWGATQPQMSWFDSSGEFNIRKQANGSDFQLYLVYFTK